MSFPFRLPPTPEQIVRHLRRANHAVYWADIGRVAFARTELELLAATGNHSENPTMSLPSRTVFDHGQKPIELIGPALEAAPEVVALQRAFWSVR